MEVVCKKFVLLLSCLDRPGIVHAVAGFLADRGCNILDSAQFGDVSNNRFFIRVCFSGTHSLERLAGEFTELADAFAMQWSLNDTAIRPGVVIMVSKFGHCLNDLLFRHRSGLLHVDIRAIVSNHPDFYPLASSYNIPFHCFPVDQSKKAEQEDRVFDVIESTKSDFVVLARYMQILSDNFCARLVGRAINIHHSFLPGFKGARPYHQAYERGVKVIGATAHYVTAELDEGPIIGQEVIRVDHASDPETLANIGRDAECIALAHAVKWHAEHRIILNGRKTVVFR